MLGRGQGMILATIGNRSIGALPTFLVNVNFSHIGKMDRLYFILDIVNMPLRRVYTV